MGNGSNGFRSGWQVDPSAGACSFTRYAVMVAWQALFPIVV
jgi:hypothetical protein